MLCQIWFIQAPGRVRDSVTQALAEEGFRIEAFDAVEHAISRMPGATPPRMIILCMLSAALAAPSLALSLAQSPQWAGVPILAVNALAGHGEPAEAFRGTVRLLCGEG